MVVPASQYDVGIPRRVGISVPLRDVLGSGDVNSAGFFVGEAGLEQHFLATNQPHAWWSEVGTFDTVETDDCADCVSDIAAVMLDSRVAVVSWSPVISLASSARLRLRQILLDVCNQLLEKCYDHSETVGFLLEVRSERFLDWCLQKRLTLHSRACAVNMCAVMVVVPPVLIQISFSVYTSGIVLLRAAHARGTCSTDFCLIPSISTLPCRWR